MVARTIGQLVSPAFVGVPQPGPQGPPGPGGGGGGSATTTASFNQPLVWTVAVQTTLSIQISSSAGMQAGQGLTIVPNAGAYLISAVPDATHVTILNTGAAGNVTPGTNVASGAYLVVTGSGNPIALAASTQGQKLVNISGTMTPMVGEVPVFCTGIRSLHPNASNRHMLPVDGYATSGDGGEGIFNYRVGSNLYDDGGTTFVDATQTLTGTFSCTYNSTTIVASLSQTGLILPNAVLTVDTGLNKAGVTQRYDVASVSGTTITLQTPYGGATASGLTATQPLGGWCRAGVTDFLVPAWYGAFGDGSNDTPILQAMADLSKNSGPRSFALKLSTTQWKTLTESTSGQTYTLHRISGQPLVINDLYDPCGNACHRIYSEQSAGLAMKTAQFDIRTPNNDFLGPLVINGYLGYAATPQIDPVYGSGTYNSHSFSTVGIGDHTGGSLHSFNLSTYDIGDITGYGQIGVEMFINPPVTPAGDSILFCHGGVGAVGFPASNSLEFDVHAGSVSFTMKTTGGTYTVSSATAAIGLVGNKANYVEIAYDGTTLRMFLGTDGVNLGSGASAAVCLTGMSVAATGTFNPTWYQEFRIGAYRMANWGYTYGDAQFAALECASGPFRVSNVARHTASTAFTPDPTKFFYAASPNPCDGNCILVLDPASANIPVRPSLNAVIIARTGANGRNGMPVWMYNNWTGGVPYTPGSRFEGIVLHNAFGCGLQFYTALYATVNNCLFIGMGQAVNVDRYSYGFNMIGNCTFLGCGGQNGRPNFASWNIMLGNGSQFATIGPGVVSVTCTTAWHIVQMFSSLRIDSAFLTQQSQGQIWCAGATDAVYLNNMTIDDEGGVATVANIYFQGNRLKVDGGWLNSYGGGALPGVLIGRFLSSANAGANGPGYVDIGATIFSGRGIAFSATAKADGYPVLWTGGGWNINLIDTILPGPVIHHMREIFGYAPVTMLNASTTLTQNHFLYKVWEVDCTAMTGDQPLLAPFTNLAGYHRTVRLINNTHTVTLKNNDSTGTTVAMTGNVTTNVVWTSGGWKLE